ncbi:MAG: hypothetical protein RLZZ623_3126 [Actinomycetota bacterium]
MERSESGDAWDEGDEPDAYPLAPAPAHERTWRHPSELGQTTWAATEPPVAIGRGLMVTTGAIGCALGVAVLWLLTPIGGGLTPTASPIATSSVTTVSTVRNIAPATSVVNIIAGSTTTSQSSPPTLPTEEVPVNTVMVLTNQQVEPQSIAVAIGAAPFIVTTASAVSGNADVGLVTIGAPADGVVTIQGDLAFIETNPSIEVVGFERVAAADPGQPLLVLTDTITEITNDEQGTASLDVDTIIEGTPVIDTDGALVALCTMVTDASGAHIELLPLADLITGSPGDTGVDSGTTTSTSTPATSPDDTADGWLGVRLHASPSDGSLTITAVAPSSPADTAGLLVGDQIIAIDDVPIATIDDVFQLITGKQPGTVVDITVLRMAPTDTSVTTSSPSSSTPAGATVERTVSVTLGAYEPSV